MSEPSNERSDNPYVGPRTFVEAEGHLFFGREREARDLTARIASERLLLFYAQSGAGKSSLINTRVIPWLRDEEGFRVLPVGRVSGELPPDAAQGANIYTGNLMSSLDQSGAQAGTLAQVTLSDFLARLEGETVVEPDGRRHPRWVYRPTLAVGRPVAAVGPGPGSPRFVLVIDQFEEIITAHPERWEEREQFFRQLNQALLDDPSLWVVLTLREDYVASLDPYAPLLFNRLRARFYMERMGADAALEAIRLPAELELGGQPFAPGVAEKLVDDLRQVRLSGQSDTIAGPYVEPVQLQVVCYQLWEKRRRVVTEAGAVQITFEELAEGNVDQALTQFYEETLAAALADPAARGVSERHIRTWFEEKLITEAGTRSLVRQNKEDADGLSNSVVHLLQRRFLVRSEPRGADSWIELVHDRFVEPIRSSNKKWFPAHLSTMQRQAELWVERGRPRDLLLRGKELAQAKEWATEHDSEMEPHERSFMTACLEEERREARERRQINLIRGLGIAGVVISLIAIAFAVFAWDRSKRAENALGQAEAAEQQAVDAKATAEANTVEAHRQQRIAEQEKLRADAVAAKAKAGELAAEVQVELKKPIPDSSLALLLARQAVETIETEGGAVTSNVYRSLVDAINAAPPYLTTLPRRHIGNVLFASYSPDGKFIVTTGDDQTARIWDAATNQEKGILRGHAAKVSAAAYRPDNQWIATASADKTARIWDATSGQELRALSGHTDAVNSVAFSPDGKFIVTGSDDQTARIWDASSGQEKLQLTGHTSRVTSAAYSPDGRQIITSGDDQTVRVWDANSGQELRQLIGHSGSINSVAFSPDGQSIVSAGADRTARVWDVATGQPLGQLSGHTNLVRYAAFSPDGSRIVTASDDQTARIWDTSSQQEMRKLTGHTAIVYSATFSPDGKLLITSSADDTARIWRASSGREVVLLVGHGEELRSAAFDPNGKHVVTASSDKTARIWDAYSGRELRQLIGHDGQIQSAAYSPDSKEIVTASDDQTIRIWDAATGRVLHKLIGHTGVVRSGTYSPDGTQIVSAGTDGTARIWDATTGQELRSLIGHTGTVLYAVFSPDGKHISTVGDDQTVRIWGVSTGEESARLVGHTRRIPSVNYSPDGKYLVTASGDRTARIWDAATGQEVRQLVGHTDSVRSASYSPDGQHVVTASWDQTIRIWDSATGEELTQLIGHTGAVYSAAYSSDGTRIVTASDDQTARIWDASSWTASIDELLTEAARLIQRDPPVLTPEERRRYGLE